jgi:hypothetical protein
MPLPPRGRTSAVRGEACAASVFSSWGSGGTRRATVGVRPTLPGCGPSPALYARALGLRQPGRRAVPPSPLRTRWGAPAGRSTVVLAASSTGALSRRPVAREPARRQCWSRPGEQASVAFCRRRRRRRRDRTSAPLTRLSPSDWRTSLCTSRPCGPRNRSLEGFRDDLPGHRRDRGRRSSACRAASRASTRRNARRRGRATAAELFAAVVEEVVAVLDVPAGWLCRFEPDRSVSVLASLNDPGFPVGSRWQLDGPSLSATILETGQPARIDDYSQLGGTIGAMARESGTDRRSASRLPSTAWSGA